MSQTKRGRNGKEKDRQNKILSQTKRGRNGKEKDRQNEILSQNPNKTQRERSTGHC